MNDAELDLRIRDLLEEVNAEAPAPPPFPGATEASRQSAGAADYVSCDPRERRRPRARVLVAAAATVAVIIAGVLVWTRGTEGSAPPAEPGPVITGEVVEVVHEVWQYTQSADPTCPNGEVSTGEFATFTIETWTDLSGARVRQDIVYPDGTSRSVLQLDAVSSVRPDPVRSGEPRGQIVGCRGVMNFLTEPATLGLEDLTTPVGPAFATTPEGLGPYAAHAEAPQVDSLGRPAELWTVTGGGSIESVGLVRDDMNYYLDPDTGLLIERVLNEQVAPYGSFTQRFTRTSREQVSVGASIFDPAALDGVSTTAATVPAAVFQEEGTCARGGSASVCFIRRDGALLVKGAGLAPDSTVEFFFNVGGIRRSSSVVVGVAGMIDTQAVVDPIEPAGAAIVVGVAGLAADGYPLNNSITDRP